MSNTVSSSGQYVRLRHIPSYSTPPEINRSIQDDVDCERPLRPRRKLRGRVVLTISLILNIVTVCILLFSTSPDYETLTYSPAMKASQVEQVVFSSAFGIERSPFQGEPSDANDKLWAGLYDFGITRISTEEARPMVNKTLPVADGQGGYIIQLAVFHQLHCLGIYHGIDMSNTDDLMGIEHMDHCIDMLRQSIMCQSDISPTTFTRTSLGKPMQVVAEVAHTCRSFSKIQQWAWNRRIKGELDKNTVVTDDPLGWGTYTYSP